MTDKRPITSGTQAASLYGRQASCLSNPASPKAERADDNLRQAGSLPAAQAWMPVFRRAVVLTMFSTFAVAVFAQTNKPGVGVDAEAAPAAPRAEKKAATDQQKGPTEITSTKETTYD